MYPAYSVLSVAPRASLTIGSAYSRMIAPIRIQMSAARTLIKTAKLPKVLLWRCFWALVLVLHAPITWHVFTNRHASRWSSIVLLVLSNAFFVLEVCAPRFIKLVTDRRSAIVFLMIVALLHVGVLERGFPAIAATWDHGASLLCTILGTL